MRHRKTGHALLVALIVLLLIASAATTIAMHFGFRARLVSQESRRVHLVALADAAIAESLARLDQNSSYGGLVERDFGGGTIASTVTKLPGNRRDILATASYRGWERRVQVRVHMPTGGPRVEAWTSLPPTPH